MKTDSLKTQKLPSTRIEAAHAARESKRRGAPAASRDKSRTAPGALSGQETTSHVPHLVWIADLSGQCTHVNQRFEQFTGAGQEELTNTAWTNFLHPDDVVATTAAWLHSVRCKVAHQTRYRVRRHDETYVWMLARAVLVEDPPGRASHWVGTNTDVHELQQLINAEHESHTVERHFTRALAYDLRTPLELIESAAESALGSSDDLRGVEKSLRSILKHVDRLDSIVDDLLYVEPA